MRFVHLKTIIAALVSVLIVSFSLAPTHISSAQVGTPDFRIVGYYTSYSIYDEQYFVTDIPVNLLTHINYGYINVSDNLQCESSDLYADTQYLYPGDRTSERIRGNFKQLQLLKTENPDLEILMTIGGWEGSDNFSDAALTQESRERFVRSCVAYMRENSFDGIDIDWRYPVVGGKDPSRARPEDAANFPLLLAEFRGQLEHWSGEDDRRYLLTMAAPAVESLYSNYPLELIHGEIDWLNLMAFGFYGDWSPTTDHFAGLYANRRDPAGADALTVSSAVDAYLDAGVPADKIVLGIPFYAQTWRNVRPNDFFGIFQTAEGVPTGTRTGGVLYYEDLASFLSSPSYTRFFDDEAKAAWMYNADRRIAISYEDEQSILNKMVYVRETGLGGVAIFELAWDDSAHTLLTAVHEGLIPNPAA